MALRSDMKEKLFGDIIFPEETAKFISEVTKNTLRTNERMKL